MQRCWLRTREHRSTDKILGKTNTGHLREKTVASDVKQRAHQSAEKPRSRPTPTTDAEWPDLPTDCRNHRNLALAFPLPSALSSLVASGCSNPAGGRMSSRPPVHIARLQSSRWEDS